MHERTIPGAYCWLFGPEGESYFLPLPKEDFKKGSPKVEACRVGRTKVVRELRQNMLGVLSGGIEQRQKGVKRVHAKVTLWQEALQELRDENDQPVLELHRQQISNSLPRIAVGQRRDGQQIIIRGVGYSAALNELQVRRLSHAFPNMVRVENRADAFNKFLAEQRATENLRPFVESVIANNLEAILMKGMHAAQASYAH